MKLKEKNTREPGFTERNLQDYLQIKIAGEETIMKSFSHSEKEEEEGKKKKWLSNETIQYGVGFFFFESAKFKRGCTVSCI